MKSKRTSIEMTYLWWHRVYGNGLILCFISGLLEDDLRILLAYALIPQGVFQIINGIIALLKPSYFRLKERKLLCPWALITLLVMYSIWGGNQSLIDILDEIPLIELWATIIIIGLPILQYHALTSKKFKY